MTHEMIEETTSRFAPGLPAPLAHQGLPSRFAASSPAPLPSQSLTDETTEEITSRFAPGLPAPLARQDPPLARQGLSHQQSPRQSQRQGQPALRADAQRNRARILDAAESVFAEFGASASTEEVASRAGVAIGTVFRHFPTKRDLLAEIMKGLGEQLTEQVRALASTGDQGSALFEFFVGVVEQAMVRKTVVELLAQSCVPSGQDAEQDVQLREAVEVLLVLAQQAGTVRRDVRIDDVMALLVAASQGALRAGWDRQLRERTVSIIFDGLRVGVAGARHELAQEDSERDGLDSGELDSGD